VGLSVHIAPKSFAFAKANVTKVVMQDQDMLLVRNREERKDSRLAQRAFASNGFIVALTGIKQ
jgi:hypothetical protein